MVGTRHAVSDNNSKSGLGMPSPYIPEREQGKRKSENGKRKTSIPPPSRRSSSPLSQGDKESGESCKECRGIRNGTMST